MEFKRLALMGAGSLGTILGAFLTKAGYEIDMIDANKAHVEAMRKNGARVIGMADFTVPVRAMTPDEMSGEYDLFLYLAKQTYNDVAIPQMVSHLAPGGYICTFQNGIPEPRVAEYIGEDRVLGATVIWGATWQGPGVSELTSDKSGRYFDIGTISGEVTDELLQLQKILQAMCPAEIKHNWMGARWHKLLVNCAMSGMSAALGCTFGDVLDNPKSLLCAEHIARECVRATAGQGITLDVREDLENLTLDKVFEFSNAEEKVKVDANFEHIWGVAQRRLKASMLQDIEKGIKCEIEQINGVLSEGGRKGGVPTPVNDKTLEIIRGIEAGTHKPSMQNLDLYDMFDGVEIRKGYTAG